MMFHAIPLPDRYWDSRWRGILKPEVIFIKKRRDRRSRTISGIESVDRPISEAYPVLDTDLARDNLENDIPAADLEDL